MNFLDRAVEIAKRVDPHLTRPNPRVGCVVVRDGKIVSEGAHEKYGGPHAEVNALNSNPGSNFPAEPGFEIYITLEPCDHFEEKKTPSCTDLLIRTKPKKVIIGCLDPKFGGKNVEKLRKAGIEVEVRKEESCTSLNTFFVQSFQQKRPYLTLKLAQSLDGKITNPGVEYLSNETSRDLVQQLRAQYSAILTTTKTVRIDDPVLNVRLESFHRPFSNPDILVLGDRPVNKKARIFSVDDRKIHPFPHQDLKKTLEECYTLEIDSILTECGAEMATKLLQEHLVNEIILFTAPTIVGTGKDTFTDEVSLENFKLVETKELDGDVMMRFTLRPSFSSLTAGLSQ